MTATFSVALSDVLTTAASHAAFGGRQSFLTQMQHKTTECARKDVGPPRPAKNCRPCDHSNSADVLLLLTHTRRRPAALVSQGGNAANLSS